MAAIAVSADGLNIFLGLEDGSGFPVIAKAVRSDLATFSAAYSPGAGSAANVAAAAGEPDVMYFYGNFGTDVTVIKHTISGPTNDDISPASLGAKVVNTLEVDPSDANRLIITVDTDQDLLETEDAGSNWVALNETLGLDATALKVFWSGDYDYHRLWLGGQVTGAAAARYSPNEGTTLSDVTGAGLGVALNVAGIDGVGL